MNKNSLMEVKRIKEEYPPGTRLKLIGMKDPYALPSGVQGTVESVDDMAQIHVKWDNGSELAVIPDIDEFFKLGTEFKVSDNFNIKM